MRIVIGTALAASLLVAGGCGGDSTDATTSVEAVPVSTTPRPDATQAADIEAAVDRVYPGVPAGKAADWAVSVCSDILRGLDPAQVQRNAQLRYAGGTRLDPTKAQAAQIVEIVSSSGFCPPN